MKNYKVTYIPFKGSQESEMETEAGTDWAAEQNVVKLFPNGDILSVTELRETPTEVIWVDFKAKKVLKRVLL